MLMASVGSCGLILIRDDHMIYASYPPSPHLGVMLHDKEDVIGRTPTNRPVYFKGKIEEIRGQIVIPIQFSRRTQGRQLITKNLTV